MKAFALRLSRLIPILAVGAGLTFATAGCQVARGGAPAATPTVAPASKAVFSGTYSGNIQPIFDQKCVSCHGPSRAENGLRLDSYEGVMKGTQFGPIVTPGQPSQSALVSVIRGTGSPGGVPATPGVGIKMPHGGVALSDQEIQNIVLWVQAGAPKS